MNYYEIFNQKCLSQLVLSREKNENYHYGRVTDLLDTLSLELNIHFYLCGLDAMIVEVTEWLENKGIDSANIHREVFFYASH